MENKLDKIKSIVDESNETGDFCASKYIKDIRNIIYDDTDDSENTSQKETTLAYLDGLIDGTNSCTKIGKWVDDHGNTKCINCGASYEDLYPDYDETHFCPNCGSLNYPIQIKQTIGGSISNDDKGRKS